MKKTLLTFGVALLSIAGLTVSAQNNRPLEHPVSCKNQSGSECCLTPPCGAEVCPGAPCAPGSGCVSGQECELPCDDAAVCPADNKRPAPCYGARGGKHHKGFRHKGRRCDAPSPKGCHALAGIELTAEQKSKIAELDSMRVTEVRNIFQEARKTSDAVRDRYDTLIEDVLTPEQAVVYKKNLESRKHKAKRACAVNARQKVRGIKQGPRSRQVYKDSDVARCADKRPVSFFKGCAAVSCDSVAGCPAVRECVNSKSCVINKCASKKECMEKGICAKRNKK